MTTYTQQTHKYELNRPTQQNSPNTNDFDIKLSRQSGVAKYEFTVSQIGTNYLSSAKN